MGSRHAGFCPALAGHLIGPLIFLPSAFEYVQDLPEMITAETGPDAGTTACGLLKRQAKHRRVSADLKAQERGLTNMHVVSALAGFSTA